MMKHKMSFVCLLFVAAFLSSFSAHAQSATPQENLNQYIADLQKNPNDNALREKIIKHVQEMKLTPKIPESVDELVGQAKYVFKHAKTQEDYLGAVEAYKKIVNITPWVGDYYYNLGVAQEQAGQPNDAINSFKLYLLASPDAKDAKEVRERIGGLKYAAEKAAKDKELAAKKAVEDKRAQQEDAEAKKAREQEEFLKKINGARYIYRWYGAVGGQEDGYGTLDVLGDTITKGVCTTRALDRSVKVGVWRENGVTFKIDGRTLRGFMFDKAMGGWTGVISDDGSTITEILDGRRTIYKRER